jgi:hypothetical protein
MVGEAMVGDRAMRGWALFLIGLGAAVSFAAPADSAPVYHAGEWQTRNDAGPAHLLCERNDHVMDQATIGRMMNQPGMSCAPGDLHTVGPVTTFSTSCKVAGGLMTMNDTITWQGPDTYTSRVRSHFAGGKIAIPDMDMTQVARRLGPCRPGDTPSRY